MLRLSAFIAIGLLTALPVYAQPQVPCTDKAQMHIKLKQQYGETTVVRGITSSSMMFELLLNPETETWTILLNSPANISCLVGQGTGIEFLAEAPCYRRSKDVKSNRGYKSRQSIMANRLGRCLKNCARPFLQAHRRSEQTRAMDITPILKA